MALSTDQYGYLIDPLVPITDEKGTTIKDGFLRVYIAGSSTPVITYRNYDGAANEQTIELDNSGRCKHPVIVSKSLAYKVVVYDAKHSQETPIITVDKMFAIGASVTAGAGSTIVQGLDNVEGESDGFVTAEVVGTTAHVKLDATNVSHTLTGDAAVSYASNAGYMVPALSNDPDDPGDPQKLPLAWIYGNRLNAVHTKTEITDFADDNDGFLVDSNAGPKFMKWKTLANKVLGFIKSLSTTITAFRTGDVIPVDGPSGTAKMSKDDLLKETAENANSKLINVGKNLWNANDVYVGYIKANGTLDSYYNGYRSSGFIEVKPSTDYYASKVGDAVLCGGTGKYFAFYDVHKTFISSIASTTKSFTTPANAKYARFSSYLDGESPTIQIEEGSARTEFYEYNPVGGYKSENYQNGSVNDEALANPKATILCGKNLFDKAKVSVGFVNSNGTINSGYSSYRSSDYVEVSPSTNYHVSLKNDGAVCSVATTYIAFYDAGKNCLSSVSAANVKDITTPLNTKFVRFTIYYYASTFDTIQFELGSARTEFYEYNPVGGYKSENYQVGSIGDEALTNPKVDVSVGKNLFDSSAVSVGFVKSNGDIDSYYTNYRSSDFIKISASTAYHLSTSGDGVVCNNANTYIAFYDAGKVRVSSTPSNVKDFTTPANAVYVRFSIFYDALTFDTIQLEKGSARTAYEKYSPIGGYLGSDAGSSEVKFYQRVTTRILPATKMSAVCFVFDDGVSQDDSVAAMFESYGVRCGFALPWGTSSVNARIDKYKYYQRFGFSCLNHTGERLDSYADETEANAVVAGGKFNLEKNGLCVNGWVCPENVYVTAYRDMLGKYHGYAFGDHGDGDKNTTASDILRLRRHNAEDSSISLATMEQLIDDAITNGYMYCFYAHSNRIGGSGYHDMEYWQDLIEYVIAKRNAGNLFFDNPDNVVKYYFDL